MHAVRISLAVLALGALTSVATAEPVLPRVLTAPTAWLPPAGAVIASATAARYGSGSVDLGVGLGIASIELGIDRDIRGCTVCEPDSEDRDIENLWLGRAALRLGSRENALFRGMPALLLGLRNTFAARGHTFGAARVTEAYVVASSTLGEGVRIHAGGAVIDAAFDEREVELGPTVRPFGGLEWTPSIYPRTTLLADIAWQPRLAPEAVALEWTAGWGVRYQALPWTSIELAVKHRQDEGLGDSNVMVRINAVLAPRKAGRRLSAAPAP